MISTQGLEKAKVQHKTLEGVASPVAITLEASEETHVLFQIQASLSAVPATPVSLEVRIGGTVVFGAYLSEAGIQDVVFYRPLYGYENQAMVVALGSGGAGVTGILNIQYG